MKTGERYRDICSKIAEKLDEINQNQNQLQNYFNDIPIVYFVLKSTTDIVVEESNRCEFHCEAIASY